MPYPFETPKVKHRLVSIDIPPEGSDIMQAMGFSSTQDVFRALDVPAAGHKLQLVSDVYSYGDAPTPALSRDLAIIGVADSSVGLVRRVEDLLRPCTVATKRADGSHAHKIKDGDRKNAMKMAKFLRRLRDADCVAVIALDKYRRFGILQPTEDMVSTGSEWEAQDFAAALYTGELDQVRKSLSSKKRPAPPPVEEEPVDDGVMWKPPTSPDVPEPAAPSADGALWKPPGTSTTDDFASTNNDADDGGWGNDDGDGGWGNDNGDTGWGNNDASTSNTWGNDTSSPQEEATSNDPEAYHADKGAAAAAKFYDSLRREQDTRAASRIFHMRAFNGWVKATQIQELNPNGRRTPLRVLDLACGKGGDLGKWNLHNRGIGNYVGIDVARKSLEDGAVRVRKMRAKFPRCTLTCADLGADVPGRLASTRHKHLQRLPTWSLQGETPGISTDPVFVEKRGGGIALEDSFDVVSIQFAIHYMMQTRKRARRYFQTVSDLLDIGGNMIATTIDARVVVGHLMNMGLDLHNIEEPVIISVGAGACRIQFEPDVARKLFSYAGNLSSDVEEVKERFSNKSSVKEGVDEDLFGLEYTFTLVEGSDHAGGVGDAVNLPEWLIPIPVLQALACEAGLELEYAENFHEFFQNRSDPSLFSSVHSSMYNMKVLNRTGSISSEEYEISRLYCALKFRKVRESMVDPKFFTEDGEGEEEEEEELDVAVKQKFLPMAMIKAKRAVGDGWSTLSTDERAELVDAEVRKLAKAAS